MRRTWPVYPPNETRNISPPRLLGAHRTLGKAVLKSGLQVMSHRTAEARPGFLRYRPGLPATTSCALTPL